MAGAERHRQTLIVLLSVNTITSSNHQISEHIRAGGSPDQRDGGGFTLVELSVVIALLMLGAMMLAPTLARTSAVSPASRCFNNLPQLRQAWAMFEVDNDGRFVPNSGGYGVDFSRWAVGSQDWDSASANTNRQYLSNAALGAYTAPDLGIYKCPADRIPASNGPRVRSYSMNGFVGGTTELSVYGYSAYRVFLKEADLVRPGAANTFVLLDEYPDSINDELLGIQMTPYTIWPGPTVWDDVPASHHNGAGAFSFGDGHVELHLWRDKSTKVPVTRSTSCSATGTTSPNDNRWFSSHATAPR